MDTTALSSVSPACCAFCTALSTSFDRVSPSKPKAASISPASLVLPCAVSRCSSFSVSTGSIHLAA